MSEYRDPRIPEEFTFIYPLSPIHNVPTRFYRPHCSWSPGVSGSLQDSIHQYLMLGYLQMMTASCQCIPSSSLWHFSTTCLRIPIRYSLALTQLGLVTVAAINGQVIKLKILPIADYSPASKRPLPSGDSLHNPWDLSGEQVTRLSLNYDMVWRSEYIYNIDLSVTCHRANWWINRNCTV